MNFLCSVDVRGAATQNGKEAKDATEAVEEDGEENYPVVHGQARAPLTLVAVDILSGGLVVHQLDAAGEGSVFRALTRRAAARGDTRNAAESLHLEAPVVERWTAHRVAAIRR